MGLSYEHLSLDERRQIFRLSEAKLSVRLIAERLGRHRSSIHRELRRNRHEDTPSLRGYFPVTAHGLMATRRRRLGKLYRDPKLAAHVVAGLMNAWSPEQIAGRLRCDGEINHGLCHETIYQYVYGPVGRTDQLYRLLPRGRRRRRIRYARKPHGLNIPDVNTIVKRPADVDDRIIFGHWECDLIAFEQQFGHHNLTTLVERTSRYVFVNCNPSRHSAGVMSGIVANLHVLPPEARRTITFDRGTEFAAYMTLKHKLGATSYFCAPKAPWQKGTVENTNGRLRRFLPRNTEIAALSLIELEAIVVRLNATPRKCLAFRTPKEVFDDHVTGLTGGSINTNLLSHFG